MNKDFWERIDRLEELARKATQGEWKHIGHGYIKATVSTINSTLANNVSIADGDYIATANPTMIQEMIAEMRKLEKVINWLADYLCDIAYTRDVKPCEKTKTCRECWIEAAKKAIKENKND